MAYLWVKAIHLIFVIAWMASMLMYPRLKIYQLAAQPGEPLFEQMKEAAHRLRKIIMTPGILVVWALGIALVIMNPAVAGGGWFAVKLALVLVISALHGWFVGIGKKIDAGAPSIDAKKLRLMNEIPFVAMIGIVILVIVKPF